MNKTSNILWGLVLVAIGVIFGLNALNITNITIFFDGWWTLFIIVPCFISLFKHESKTGNIIGIIVGICLLLASQKVINFEIIWKLMVPFILVAIGISIIFKDSINSKVRKEIKKLNKNNLKEYSATFGGQSLNFNKEEFESCSLNAVFGSVKCDLTQAIIKEDVVVEASAIFGGISILVPDNVNVKISSTPIFGGVSDERKTRSNESKQTIYINAVSMFGGVEIK